MNYLVCRKLTLALEKRAQVENDEWGKIFRFCNDKGKKDAKMELEEAWKRKLMVRQQLEDQMKELEMRKKAEREEAAAFARSDQVCLDIMLECLRV